MNDDQSPEPIDWEEVTPPQLVEMTALDLLFFGRTKVKYKVRPELPNQATEGTE